MADLSGFRSALQVNLGVEYKASKVVPIGKTMHTDLSDFQLLVSAKLPYIDTVKFFVPEEVPDALRAGMLSAGFAGFVCKPEEMPMRSGWHSLVMHQPTRSGLEFVESNFDRYVISRVDVSLDLVVADRLKALQLKDFLRGHLIQRWKPKRPAKDCKTTAYYARANARNGLVIYGDKPSKISGDSCCHLEWRINGAGACHSAGFSEVRDLLELNHTAFWERRLPLYDLPSGQAGLEKLGRFLSPTKKGVPTFIPIGRGNLRLNRFVRVASSHLRSLVRHEGSAEPTVQDVVDLLGPTVKNRLIKLPHDWMLPNAQPHD